MFGLVIHVIIDCLDELENGIVQEIIKMLSKIVFIRFVSIRLSDLLLGSIYNVDLSELLR